MKYVCKKCGSVFNSSNPLEIVNVIYNTDVKCYNCGGELEKDLKNTPLEDLGKEELTELCKIYIEEKASLHYQNHQLKTKIIKPEHLEIIDDALNTELDQFTRRENESVMCYLVREQAIKETQRKIQKLIGGA